MSRAVTLPPALLQRFEAAGYARAEPGVLQPAEPFLDVMGEELRQKMFLTADASGREMCLRPDFTIPTALAHIASGDPARAGSYFYAGPVFRHGSNGGEVAQAGVESFGRTDAVAAETDVLRLALESVAAFGVAEPDIRIGDRGLIDAAIEGLDAPVAYRRRLRREIANGGSPETLAGRRAKETGGSGLFTALDAAGPEAARAVIEDVLSLAGVSAVGGRTPAEIAERFLERAAANSASLEAPVKRAIGELLAIDAPAPVALATLNGLASRGELKIAGAVAALSARLDAFKVAGLPVERMRYSSRFGHKLDYYTGLVFELTGAAGDAPLAGGGRYDGLLSALGAKAPVPGVGFALWPERLDGGRR